MEKDKGKQSLAVVIGDKTLNVENDDRHQTEEHFVAFIDFLGFKEMILSDPKGEKYVSMLETAIEEAIAYADIVLKMDVEAINYRIFSDNFCFWAPVKWAPIMLANFLSIIGVFQRRMILEGIFCRGGVTIGYFTATNHILFGEALIECVLLEKEAIYPRVVISKKLIERKELLGIAGIFHQIHKLKNEETFFLNYLWDIFYIEKKKSLKMIESHAISVKKQLRIHAENDSLIKKYNWVKDFHNDIIEYLDFKSEIEKI